LLGIVLGAITLADIGERWGVVGALAASAVALAVWTACLMFMLRRRESVYRDRY
jgi:Na+-driven multidrug efflux pump